MATHFYHPKTGELIDGNLRDARKVNGLPSPTTVLGILGSPALKYYFRKQMFEATATTPRPEKMTDDEYFDLCCTSADEHGKVARDKGTDFHDLAQAFHLQCMKLGECPKHPFMPISDPLASQFNAYVEWYRQNVRRSLMVEAPVIGQGYAGRVDHVCEMMNGEIACTDPKTQDNTKKKGKFTYYSNWGVQLGAYAGAIKPMPHCLISIAVCSVEESIQVEAYRWPKEPAYYHNIFLGLLEYWKEDNSYWPS